jgi:hypothetical protein
MSQFNLIGYSNSGANVFNNLTITENGAMVVPYGVSSERPVAPVAGMLRYDTTNAIMEFYNGTDWIPVSSTTSFYYFNHTTICSIIVTVFLIIQLIS